MQNDVHLRRLDGLRIEAFRRRVIAMREAPDATLFAQLEHDRENLETIHSRLGRYATQDRHRRLTHRTARRKAGGRSRELALRRLRAKWRLLMAARKASSEILARTRHLLLVNEERIASSRETLRQTRELLGRA